MTQLLFKGMTLGPNEADWSLIRWVLFDLSFQVATLRIG
jgi:hypothetical protein